MPPRRRQQFTQEHIDQQLQQIHLLDPSSSSENLEQLGPIIRQIHSNRQQDAYLRTVNALVEAKDAEIEAICSENYQDFISSVSTLFTVKAYTEKIKDTISTLDASVAQLGGGLVDKKRALLQSRKTAANLDDAIDTLQACLRVLDVVARVGDMIKEGKYWSALRSLEDIQSMPPASLAATPFFQHLLSSLPSLRSQIKDAVTASMKQWLLEIRNISTDVGRLAAETMDSRTRRWRNRQEKDPLLLNCRVGSSVELIVHEKSEFNVLDNDRLHVDFKPLFQCIHIYTALDSLAELQRSYQADRKAQSDLILPSPLPLASLSALTQEIAGFFIVESHVLETTGNFRSPRDVEELWDTLVARLTGAIETALSRESDPEVFLQVKDDLLSFIMTLETSSYSTIPLHDFIIVLFGKYAKPLEAQLKKQFEQIVNEDDSMEMRVETEEELNEVMQAVWLSHSEASEISRIPIPGYLPWSQTFYLCCKEIKIFIQRFYSFVDGVLQRHGDIDDLLSKSLDSLLITNVSETIAQRLSKLQNMAQVAQVIGNLEHFQSACSELERTLTTLRSTQRGGIIRLPSASSSFGKTIERARTRLTDLIIDKLDQWFDYSQYEWTPRQREGSPSMYLYELVNWLTTIVDSLNVKEEYKEEVYVGSLAHIANSFLGFLTGRDVPILNEHAISNLLIDVDFLGDELKRIERPHLSYVFEELRLSCTIILRNAVQEYLVPSNRQTKYAAVKPKRLQAILDKLARYGASQRDQPARELGERRRKEAEAVGRVFPGESR